MLRTTTITITLESDTEEDIFDQHDSLIEGLESYGYRDSRTTTGGGTVKFSCKVRSEFKETM